MKTPRVFSAFCALGLLLAGVAHAGTYTVPRDLSGSPAAQCAFLGTSGASTLCSPTDPLPVVAAPTGPQASTTSSTDPTGWGQRWFQGTAVGATGFTILRPLFLTDTSAVGIGVPQAGGTFDRWLSNDKGRTWTRELAFNVAGTVTDAVYNLLLLSDGAVLVMGHCFGGVTPACTSAWRLNTDGTASVVPMAGLAPGLNLSVMGAAEQGATVSTVVGDAGGQIYFCQSANKAVSFTCGANYSVVGAALSKATESPAPNIWLRIKADGIERSTNNGTSFVAVLSGLGGPITHLECLSTTVCLGTDGNRGIYRSTNAGASWVLVFTDPDATAPLFSGMLDYGGGTVLALAGVAGSYMWLSHDSGLSWTPIGPVDANSRCNAPCSGDTRNGSGMYGQVVGVVTQKVQYSPAITPGTFQVVGPSGIPLNVNASGNMGVTQNGGGTSTSVSGAWWILNSDGSGFVGSANNPFQVAPDQHALLDNTSQTGAANTAVTATIAPAAGTRAHLRQIAAFCSAGTAGLTVTDGGTTVWLTPATAVGTTLFTHQWNTGLSGTTGANIVVTLSTCGGGNTGTLSVQADRR